MEFAQALLKLWDRKLWVALGLLVAAVAGFGARQLLTSTTYAAATTQMIVDSPRSALGDIQSSLTPFTSRAGVYALLMTSQPALDSIGHAAGIPGSHIAAQGPPEAILPQVGQQPSAPATPFKLEFNQNPALPTVDIYAQAPTTQQAVALANGAVIGFRRYLTLLQGGGSVPPGQRIEIRQLGNAIGGMVNPGSGNKMAAIAALVVFLAWCGLVLFVAKTRGALRASWHAHLASDLPSPGTSEWTDPNTVWSYPEDGMLAAHDRGSNGQVAPAPGDSPAPSDDDRAPPERSGTPPVLGGAGGVQIPRGGEDRVDWGVDANGDGVADPGRGRLRRRVSRP